MRLWRVVAVLAFASGAAPLFWLATHPQCAVYPAGASDGYPVVVAMFLVAQAVIGASYVLITVYICGLVGSLGGSGAPRWLRFLLAVYAMFIGFCGCTHLVRIIARPVVVCWSDVALLALTAVVSLVAVGLTMICTEPLILLGRLGSHIPALNRLIGKGPLAATVELRKALAELESKHADR